MKNKLILSCFLTVAWSLQGAIIQENEYLPVWYDLTNRDTDEDYKENYRTLCDQLGMTENSKIPSTTSKNNILRIATYNIHFWEYPLHKGKKRGAAFHDIQKIIDLIGADIIILQEVDKYKSTQGTVEDIFKKMGYKQAFFQDTGWLRNYIFAKAYVPVISSVAQKFSTNLKDQEQRGFVNCRIQLADKSTLSVYGTHLEIRDYKVNEIVTKTAGQVRQEQIQELLNYINQNDKNNNVLIGMDSNTVRQKDLMGTIRGKTRWEMYKEQANLKNREVSTAALDLLAKNNFVESFEKASLPAPTFTNMYGTRIDFLFMSPAWSLPIVGCYTFYAWASDHLPIIMDIQLPGTGCNKRDIESPLLPKE